MDSRTVSSAIAKFSAKFCKELPTDKNVISSPLSAEFLLALLTLGTSDPAHSELLQSLELPDDDTIRSSFSTLSSELKGIKNVTLNVANKVYIQEGDYDLQPQLKEDAVNIFDAALEKINFKESASAVETINGWVESKTNNKIKDLLSDEDVDRDTRLILVNALYFKGAWKDPFDPSATTEHPFYLSDNSTTIIPMMSKEHSYPLGFSEELQAQLLEIPYVNEEASMLIVLPNEIEGLNDVMTKLAAGHDLMAEIANMRKRNVLVTMPKFKIETLIDLKNLLIKIGINAIFDEHNSGLTKILNKPERLVVSEAVQKAFIEVNEEGAEAAAATGKKAIKKKKGPMEFYANKPYLFLLLGGNQVPVFVGVYRGI